MVTRHQNKIDGLVGFTDICLEQNSDVIKLNGRQSVRPQRTFDILDGRLFRNPVEADFLAQSNELNSGKSYTTDRLSCRRLEPQDVVPITGGQAGH